MEKNFKCQLCNVDLQCEENFKAHNVGKKHTKLLQYTQRKIKREECGIFVSDLPYNYDFNELSSYIKTFGAIEKSHVKQLSKNFSCAMFLFEDKASAEKIKSVPSHRFRGCIIRIRTWKFAEKNPGVSNAQIKGQKLPAAKPVTISSDSVLATLGEATAFESQLSALENSVLPIGYVPFYFKLCEDLNRVLQYNYPRCSVHPFGSTITGLAFKGSDVDIFLELAPGQHASPSAIKNQLYHHLNIFKNIIAITGAKVPIVKFVHIPTDISCDISFANALGVRNTYLIKHFMSVDSRVKQLLFIMKYWIKHFEVTGTNNNKLSNYALTMKVLFYLQQLEVPIIPSVKYLQDLVVHKEYIDGWESSFDTNLPWVHEVNTSSVPDLVVGFFEYYSNFNYSSNLICPLIGQAIPRYWFGNYDLLSEDFHHYKVNCEKGGSVLQVEDFREICVQDVFVLNHNLTRALTAKSVSDLKAYYKASAEVGKEALKSGTAGFLSALLSDKTRKKAVSYWCRAELSVHNVVVRPDSTVFRIADINISDQTRTDWYSQTYRTLLEILTDVCKLQVEEVLETATGNGDTVPGSKVPKIEGQTDIHAKPFTMLEPSTLRCRGCHSIMDGRKVVKKSAAFSSATANDTNLNIIKREIMISDIIVQQQDKLQLKEDVDFTCQFMPKTEPTRVELAISEQTPRKIFKKWILFFQANIPQWINNSFEKK